VVPSVVVADGAADFDVQFATSAASTTHSPPATLMEPSIPPSCARTRAPPSVFGLLSWRSTLPMIHALLMMKLCVARIAGPVAMILTLAAAAPAQTIDDGIMLTKHELIVGDLYTQDSWEEYWEGLLKRVNGNIGTITTQNNSWFGNYGVTNRLNAIVIVPFVWTHASQGVLHGMQGLQDLTVGGKYVLVTRPSTRVGAVQLITAVAAGIPLTDYTPDFQPLSIGSASRRLSGRATLNLCTPSGWYFNVSTSYGWRAHVTLDRPYYFTEDQLFFTNEVDMPNVFDYVATTGYMKGSFAAMASFSEQLMQGGGDIRRQDAPFVSNRMNYSKVAGELMVPIPRVRAVQFQLAYAYTIDGRNVGQSSTITTGLSYRFRVPGRHIP
jgi:hypothetical protein